MGLLGVQTNALSSLGKLTSTKYYFSINDLFLLTSYGKQAHTHL